MSENDPKQEPLGAVKLTATFAAAELLNGSSFAGRSRSKLIVIHRSNL